METLFVLPAPFFLSVLALLGGGAIAWKNRYRGFGLPMGMVLGTVAVWYHGDALYNDYEEYRLIMGDTALAAGWWQVLLFLVAFCGLVPTVHRILNGRFLRKRSSLMRYMETRRLERPQVQRQIDRLTIALLAVWVLLMGVALFQVDFDFVGLFMPYLGEKASPWSRGRVGGGLDAALSLGAYLQVFLTAGFGVIAAVARTPQIRALAILVCFLSFPYYLFDRTRNTMLATMLPGLLAWIFLRVQGNLVIKGAILLVAFLVVNFWFSFVIANRNIGVTQAFRSGQAMEEIEDVKHEGISMFSELGYMNDFFAKGTYDPNWGERYFAEIVNPIPRALWKNKPLVGVDYAVARGFGVGEETDSNAGIAASIATGMIGQGIVNFGRFLGPIAAALLMSMWVAVLARQDLLGKDPARLLLYSVGMILTFNMGRDITLLVLYPYVFGWLLLMLRDYFKSSDDHEHELENGKTSGVTPGRPPGRRVARGGRGRAALEGSPGPPGAS